MKAVRNALRHHYLSHGASGDSGGVEDGQHTLAGGVVVDEAAQPTSVVGQVGWVAGNEQGLGGVPRRPRFPDLACAGGEVVLDDVAQLDRFGVLACAGEVTEAMLAANTARVFSSRT